MPGNISGGGGGTFLLAGFNGFIGHREFFHRRLIRGGRRSFCKYLIQ